ncbi:MAG: penicillin-binding protein 2, partial [Segetibacter sp.]|nr:penicillin-binding protein 2 [Segetibacter sp.]
MPVLNQARQRVIQTIFIVVFLVIIGQLFHLQILPSKYTKLAKDNAITKKIVYPSRGIIYDRNKKPILDNVARFDLVVTPFQIKGIDTTTLCRILNIDTAEFRKRMVTSIIKNGRYRP